MREGRGGGGIHQSCFHSPLLGEITFVLSILLHGFHLRYSACHFWNIDFFLIFLGIERLICLFYRVRD